MSDNLEVFLELVKANVPKKNQLYAIDKIVGHKKVNGVEMIKIRWAGYGKDHDSWIKKKDMIQNE